MTASTLGTVQPTARRWLFAAGLLGLCSLGLSWGNIGSGVGYVPGWYTPGYCTTSYDADGWAYMDCTGGYISAGIQYQTGMPLPGTQHASRVTLLLAAAAVVLGLRTGRDGLVLASVPLAAAGLVVQGLSVGPGSVVYAAGLVALVVFLRADDRWNLPQRLRPAGA